jgi:glycosyltransferase involved in cell wall biosynthesis
MLTLDVLIPARDEAESLPLVLADLPRQGQGWWVRRVVVVDNGSRDRTAAVARGLGAEVVREPVAGYGRACLAGLAHLRRSPPDAVVFVDADHSDDPRDLHRVVAPLVAGAAELVIGSRVLGKRERGAFTPAQALGNRLAPFLLRRLWGVEVTDLGPFRAVRWASLERLRVQDPAHGWTVEMQARAARDGVGMVEVPVSYRRRRHGRSKISGTLGGTWRAGMSILATIARVRSGG